MRSASRACSPTPTTKGFAAYLAAVVVAAGALMARDAWFDSLTYDEAAYVDAGLCTLRTGRIDQLEPTNPPLAKLAAGLGELTAGPDVPIPGNCGEVGSPRYTPAVNRDLHRFVLAGRLSTIAVTLGAVVVLGWWVRRLLGTAAGAIGATVFALEPVALGHGHLGTSDMWLAAGAVAVIACTWHAVSTLHLRWWVLAGVAAGLATACRANGLVLLPLAGAVALAAGGLPIGPRLRTAARGGLAMVAAAWATLWTVYLPFETVLPHDSYRLAGPAVLVAPRPFLWGVAFQLRHATEQGVDNTYLNGNLHDGGVWFYFLEAIALKTTLPFLLLAATGIVVAIARRDRALAVFGLLPAAVLIAVPSAGSINIGVRYVVPAYPFLALLAASLVRLRRGLIVVAPLTLATALTALLLPASSIAYFNPIAGSHPEEYLLDSNIDWGQDAWRLKSWWEDHDKPVIVTMFFGPKSPTDHGMTNSVEARELADACTTGRLFAVSVMIEKRSELPPCLRTRRRSVIGTSIALYRR